MSIRSGEVVGYVLYNPKSGKFVGRDYQSGGYPWESDTIHGGITIWRSENEAEEYKAIRGFESFNSGQWVVYPLVLG